MVPAPDTDFDPDMHGCMSNLDDFCVTTDNIPDLHWPMEFHGFDRNSRDRAIGPFTGRYATCSIHLGQQPSTKDMAIQIEV